MNNMTNELKHVSFDEMAAYVYAKGRSKDFFSTAARINSHVMSCPDCYELYSALMEMKDQIEAIESQEPVNERVATQILRAAYLTDQVNSIPALIKEAFRFKAWLSFSVKDNMAELVQNVNDTISGTFTHPRLATVMKAAPKGGASLEKDTDIKSTLLDGNQGRVSIGLDEALSLYLDSKKYQSGKRVMLLPDDPEAEPQMLELEEYDDAHVFVRFEGIVPGAYTVVVEE